MAVTKIIPIHHNAGKSIAKCISDSTNYVINPEKTDNGKLISSYGCDYHTADEEFLLDHNLYEASKQRKSKNAVLAYHMIQSFSPGEVSQEETNKIGYETASRLLKGKYDFIVATHVDHLHIHNHIIWNATANDLSQKYRNRKGSFKDIQKLSDSVCTEHHLSVIENPSRDSNGYNIWFENQKNKPKLLVDVNKALMEKGTGYRIWAAKHNIQQLAQAYNFMRDNNISDISLLEPKISESNKELYDLRNNVRSIEKRYTDAIAMKRHLINYSKFKEIYIEYKNSGYSKEFYANHKSEIDLVKSAKEVFKIYGNDKLPTVKEMNQVISKLQKEKNAVYERLKTVSSKNKDLKNYYENIKTLLSDEQSSITHGSTEINHKANTTR